MLLYAVTIFVSAFLLFLVQPVVAKQILPWFGGSAAVWTTCLVFFQTALLAGYALDFVVRRPPIAQGPLLLFLRRRIVDHPRCVLEAHRCRARLGRFCLSR